MNSITRHDILNKVTILLGALEIAEMECNDPAILYYFNVLNEATKAIQKQIEFTRLYQDLGIQEPAWLSLLNYPGDACSGRTDPGSGT